MNNVLTRIATHRVSTYWSIIVTGVATHTRLVAWSVFALGLVVFLILRIGLILLPMQARSAPIEADDAYTYILKSVQMKTCFRQDCPALDDLRVQLSIPSPDPDRARVRRNEYGRAFLIYNPLHSALMVLFHSERLSWEETYKVIQLAGAIFISIAIAYWLVTLWGPGPTGIALALLAFMPSVGLTQPTNFVLGLAMLVWARLSARDGTTEWSLALGTLAMVAMHPIGRLYAIAAIFLLLMLTRGRVWTSRRFVGLLFSVLIVCLSFLLPLVVQRPELSIPAYPPPANWPKSWYGAFGYGVARNLGAVGLVIMESWIALYGSLLLALIITTLGFLTLPRAQRSTVIRNSLVLVGLLIISLLYVLPQRPGEGSERVWVPIGILLTGAVGQVAWRLLSEVASHVISSRRAIVSPLGRLSAGFATLSGTPSWVLVLVIVGVLVAIRVEVGVVRGVNDLKSASDKMRDVQPFAFDPVQVRLMLSQARSSDMVLYLDEVPMHFYFTHGALALRAVYYPALVNPSEAILLVPGRKSDSPRVYRSVTADTLTDATWLNSENLRYLVGWSPIQQLPESQCREAMVDLSAYQSIEYFSPEPVPLDRLRVCLVNRGGETSLRVIPISEASTLPEAETVSTKVPGEWSGWVSLPIGASGTTNRFRLDVGGAVFLTGMRVGDSELNWPWDQRVTLVFHSGNDGGSQPIRFDPNDLFPIRGLPVSVRILSDSGSTVLAELVRDSSKP